MQVGRPSIRADGIMPIDDPLEIAAARLREELHRVDPAAIDEVGALHDSLSAAVHEYCEAAQRFGLPPEQVLVRLKTIIANHFGSSLVHPGLFASDLVFRAVKRCVESYYSAHHSSR